METVGCGWIQDTVKHRAAGLADGVKMDGKKSQISRTDPSN